MSRVFDADRVLNGNSVMSLRKQIGSNIKYLLLSRVVGILSRLVIMPFMVHTLGANIYGIFLLGVTIIDYFNLMELTVTTSVTKYVAEFHGSGDSQKVKEVINGSFTLYVIIGIVISLLLKLFSASFDQFLNLHLSPAEILMLRRIMNIATVSFLFLVPLNMFKGIVQGFQRYDIDGILRMSVFIAQAVASYIVLFFGGSIVMLFFIYQLLACSAGVVFFLISYKLVGGFRITFPYFSRAVMEKIMHFSVYIFFATVVYMIMFRLGHIIIGAFLSMSAITLYNVGYSLHMHFQIAHGMCVHQLVSLSSRFEGQNSYDKQRQMYIRSTRYIIMVFIPLVLIMLFFARPFILYWMGPQFLSAVLPAQILLFVGASYSFYDAGAFILKGIGPRFVKKILIINTVGAVINLILTLFFVQRWGITGVALGTALPMLFFNLPVTIWYTLRYFQLSSLFFLQQVLLRNFLIGLVTILLSCLCLFFLPQHHLISVLLSMISIYAIVMLFNYYVLLKTEERNDIAHIIGIRS